MKVVAVASSEETRNVLYEQLQSLDFVEFNGVLIELSETLQQCKEHLPDVIIVEVSGREMDAGLFIQAILMNPATPWIVIALHRELNPDKMATSVKQGATECIHYPVEKDRLQKILKKHLDEMSRKKDNPDKPSGNSKLISVFSAKGGSGCSTVAVNIANEVFQLTKQPTVLFDMDQVFCNTALMLNIKPSYSLGDLSDNKPTDVDDALLQKIIQSQPGQFDVVVASKSVLDENDMISPELLEKTITYLRKNYEYIVVDLPTHVLDPYHQFMAEASDEMLLISCLDIPGLYRTKQYLDLAKRHLDMQKIKLVLNRWNLQAAYGMSNKSLEEEFQYPVYGRLANDWDLNVEANSLGRVLSAINPKSDMVKGIQMVARQLTGAVSNDEIKEDSSQGNLLGRLIQNVKRGNE